MNDVIQFIQTTPDLLKDQIVNDLKAVIESELSKPSSEVNPFKLLTRQETAEMLSIDLSTLYHWTKKGKLKSYGMGNRVYYKRNEIEKQLIELSP